LARFPVSEGSEADVAGAGRQAGAEQKPRAARATATPPRVCTVGAGFYPEHAQRVPLPGLGSYWLEQLRFGIGCKLSITARNGELIVRVEDDAKD